MEETAETSVKRMPERGMRGRSPIVFSLIFCIVLAAAAAGPGEQLKEARRTFDRREYTEAARLFGKVLASFPSAPEAAVAAYYLGLSYERLKQYDAARRAYQRLVKEYGNSEMVRFAKRRLKEIESLARNASAERSRASRRKSSSARRLADEVLEDILREKAASSSKKRKVAKKPPEHRRTFPKVPESPVGRKTPVAGEGAEFPLRFLPHKERGTAKEVSNRFPISKAGRSVKKTAEQTAVVYPEKHLPVPRREAKTLPSPVSVVPTALMPSVTPRAQETPATGRAKGGGRESPPVVEVSSKEAPAPVPPVTRRVAVSTISVEMGEPREARREAPERESEAVSAGKNRGRERRKAEAEEKKEEKKPAPIAPAGPTRKPGPATKESRAVPAASRARPVPPEEFILLPVAEEEALEPAGTLPARGVEPEEKREARAAAVKAPEESERPFELVSVSEAVSHRETGGEKKEISEEKRGIEKPAVSPRIGKEESETTAKAISVPPPPPKPVLKKVPSPEAVLGLGVNGPEEFRPAPKPATSKEKEEARKILSEFRLDISSKPLPVMSTAVWKYFEREEEKAKPKKHEETAKSAAHRKEKGVTGGKKGKEEPKSRPANASAEKLRGEETTVKSVSHRRQVKKAGKKEKPAKRGKAEESVVLFRLVPAEEVLKEKAGEPAEKEVAVEKSVQAKAEQRKERKELEMGGQKEGAELREENVEKEVKTAETEEKSEEAAGAVSRGRKARKEQSGAAQAGPEEEKSRGPAVPGTLEMSEPVAPVVPEVLAEEVPGLGSAQPVVAPVTPVSVPIESIPEAAPSSRGGTGEIATGKRVAVAGGEGDEMAGVTSSGTGELLVIPDVVGAVEAEEAEVIPEVEPVLPTAVSAPVPAVPAATIPAAQARGTAAPGVGEERAAVTKEESRAASEAVSEERGRGGLSKAEEEEPVSRGPRTVKRTVPEPAYTVSVEPLRTRLRKAAQEYGPLNRLKGSGGSAGATGVEAERREDERIHIERALALRGAGNLSGAVREYQEALAIDPRDPVARNNLADLYLEMGRSAEEAIALVKDLGKEEPRFNGAIYATLARAYYEAGDLKEAEKAISAALEIKVTAERLYQRGKIFAARKIFPRARADFDQALSITEDEALAEAIRRDREKIREALTVQEGQKRNR